MSDGVFLTSFFSASSYISAAHALLSLFLSLVFGPPFSSSSLFSLCLLLFFVDLLLDKARFSSPKMILPDPPSLLFLLLRRVKKGERSGAAKARAHMYTTQ